MIITQEKSKRVVSSHDFDSVECTIDAEDMRYVASLLRNNYSNPPLAVVREISANALDANNEANATRKVEVTIPSKFNPHFCVRDFGNGLSQEDIFGLYSKYGKSTKRNSNSYIGAFGIGKFAPLSYGNSFTCVSFHEGVKSSYNVFVNENDDTKIVKMHEEPSDKPSGLSVEVAVADEDVDTFRTIIKAFFRFFPDKEMPKFIGVGDDEEFFNKYDIVLEAKDKSWFIIDDNQDYWSRGHSEAHAFMGRVHYPLQTNSINFSSVINDDDGENINALQEICRQDNLYIRFDIGELKLHHSRESLEYNKATQKIIIEHLRRIKNDIEEIAKEKLEGATCLWDAKAKYAQVVNALPRSLQGVFENCFKWEGIPITSFAFNRPYSYHDTIIITEYTKQDDKDATDGYRVRSKKTSNIYVSMNHRLMYQDLKTPHGNALRARNIFNTDEDVEAVFVVSSDKDSATDYIFTDDDGWRFDLINDENMFKTSTTEKAKLQTGTRSSGESRASVPTFVYEPHGSRMRDQWSNGAEVDDLEKELEKEVKPDAKLVYIPISNYKPSDQDLDSLKRQYNGIKSLLHTLEVESEPLYGIRLKDSLSLDKSKWVKWDDYRIELAKMHLLDHKRELLRGEKIISYKEHRHEMHHVNALENLITNKTLRGCLKGLAKGHDVIEASTILRDSQESNAKIETLYSLKKLVMAEDENWYKDNLSIKYNWKTFNYLCKEICEKYPLLMNISKEIYGWQSLSEMNLGKNIADYISMCDKLGDEA
jgi:hypothetical protein